MKIPIIRIPLNLIFKSVYVYIAIYEIDFIIYLFFKLQLRALSALSHICSNVISISFDQLPSLIDDRFLSATLKIGDLSCVVDPQHLYY